ncbi:MAG TPA: 30S ribosome-binding factor RbfA [Terriglobales bacterium]|nr:30S ribosome-binding factor RbfA [Terriglobales bacterium]
MPEQRSREHHFERVADALRDEISSLLEGELADPRIGLATVTEVKLASDGRSARILVSVEGDDDEAQQTMEGLAAAKGYIRREVGVRLGMAHPPEMTFHLDRSQRMQARIDELLRRAEKRKK